MPTSSVSTATICPSTRRPISRLTERDWVALQKSGCFALSRIRSTTVTIPAGSDYSHALYRIPYRLLLTPQTSCPQPDLAVSLATSLALTFAPEAHDEAFLKRLA